MSRRELEIEHGKKLTMAKGLVESVSSALPGDVKATINGKGFFNDWTIEVTINSGGEKFVFQEKMDTFPSEELRTTAMLLAK